MTEILALNNMFLWMKILCEAACAVWLAILMLTAKEKIGRIK